MTTPAAWLNRFRALPPRLCWALLGLTLGALCYYTLTELGAGASSLLGPDATGMAWWAAGGALLGSTRLRLVPPVVAFLTGGLLLLVAQTPLIEAPARSLVRRDSLPKQPVSVIVVLSGAVTSSGLLQVSAADRLLQGLLLLRAGVAPRLVVSRVERDGPSGIRVDSDRDQARFFRLLTPEPRVNVLTTTSSTRQEAEQVASLARGEGWGAVVVVTSPLHSRRACAAFEAVGLTIICYPCLDREYGLERMTPGERIYAFRDWMYETAGWYAYRRRGWV